MSVRAIGAYEFPSRSRQELYGDDQLVHVLWEGNRMLCAAACFRAPKAMPFKDFLSAIVEPWASSDPAFEPGTPSDWKLDGESFEPAEDSSLEALGVGHKSVLAFRA